MKKITLFTLTLFSFSLVSTSQTLRGVLKKAEETVTETTSTSGGALSEEEVGKGLKEALTRGIEKGVDQVSKPDGYFKDLKKNFVVLVKTNSLTMPSNQ